MMSRIEWTDITWNPVTGCDRVSDGCTNCYALTMAGRLKAMGQAKYQTDGDPRTSGPGFGLAVHPDALSLPLRWRKPRRVFVCSMSDLFHDEVSASFVVRAFATMAQCPQHTFQVLTKRHARMRALLSSPTFANDVRAFVDPTPMPWPLPNVWLGVSVENQQWADIRIPALLDTPAAVRFLSCEPLLAPVDLAGFIPRPADTPWYPVECRHGHQGCPICDRALKPDESINWVIIGGESGAGARPMEFEWAQSLVDQCRAAGVACHVKQLGSAIGGTRHRDMATFPPSLRVREYPDDRP